MPIHPANHDPQEFAARLKEALIDAGHNAGHGAGAYLASRYKVSDVTANAWLNGTHMPSPSRVRQMATDYSVRHEWLYFGELPKHPTKVVGDDRGTYTTIDTLILTPADEALIRSYRAAEEAIQRLVDAALLPKAKPPKKRG